MKQKKEKRENWIRSYQIHSLGLLRGSSALRLAVSQRTPGCPVWCHGGHDCGPLRCLGGRLFPYSESFAISLEKIPSFLLGLTLILVSNHSFEAFMYCSLQYVLAGVWRSSLVSIILFCCLLECFSATFLSLWTASCLFAFLKKSPPPTWFKTTPKIQNWK